MGPLLHPAVLGDPLRAALWVGILAAGLAFCGALARLGVSRALIRDLLHVGAGAWPLGWPFWHGRIWPMAIVLAALVAAALPALWPRAGWAQALQAVLSNGDERWTGILLYVAAFAVFTAVGLWSAPFPAGAALLSLALGDGIGGAVGRRFGRHRFRAWGAKAKSLEGAAAVAVLSAAAVLLAGHWFQVPVGPGAVLASGLVAAIAEALAPRATDNLLLPAAVWIAWSLSPLTIPR